MGLNIKNETVHDAVRTLARTLGVSQTSAVEIAVRAQLAELSARDGDRDARLRAAAAAAQSVFRDVDLRAMAEQLYDAETGLPR